MDIKEFVSEKKDEILALAARHQASNIRLVNPKTRDSELSGEPGESGIKLVATFASDTQRSIYYDVLIEFQEDLEAWLGIEVHVYDANAFKGEDGAAFLRQTLPLEP